MRNIVKHLIILTILPLAGCNLDDTIPVDELIPRKDFVLTRSDLDFIYENNGFALELFKKVRTSFVQAINRESQDNQNALFLDREIWEKATPALKTLYSFRQDNDLKLLLNEVPNRGNIRRIDLQKIAESPSEGLVRFMTELYNELR